MSAAHPVLDLLRRYQPLDAVEAADVERVLALAEQAPDPWSRAIPLHLTASALIVHPAGGEILLRWHQRQQAWLQVGGHGDPGEREALAIALREASEETGLTDLAPWPDGRLRQVVVVSVPARGDEPAHGHADLRFVFSTQAPRAARPETPEAPLRWLTPARALDVISEANLRDLLARVQGLLAEHQ